MSVQILKVKEGVRHVNSHSQQSDDEHVCSCSEWTESGKSNEEQGKGLLNIRSTMMLFISAYGYFSPIYIIYRLHIFMVIQK